MKNTLKTCIVAALLLPGCSEKPAPPPAPAAAVVPEAPAPAAAPAAPQAPTNGYQATLAEGIQFATKPDYPSFIRSVTGMAGYETSGRWSEGPRAVFTFMEPLPRTFLLKLEFAGAFGPNVGKPITVKVGDWQGQFTVDGKPMTTELRVTTSVPVESIAFIIPAPVSPKALGVSGDPREVGISFVRLSIASQ